MRKRILSIVILLCLIVSIRVIAPIAVNATTGQDIVTEARKWIGTSYGDSIGNGGPGTSVDCCGLVLQVYKKFGYTLPWSVQGYYSGSTFIYGQKDCGTAITNNVKSKNYSNLKQGDLIVFYGHSGTTWHIGIYSGNGYVINAQSSGVKEAYLNNYWYQYAVGVRRILKDGDTTQTQPDVSGNGIITNTNQVLRYGDENESVRQLQTALNKVMNAGLVADGKYGQATHDAVKAFQSKYGLTVDGDAGPSTLTKLNQLAGGHTHSYPTVTHEAAHPHREFKACTCGHTEYTGKTVVVSTCSQCTTPGKPSLLNMSDIYYAGNEIELKWNETVNTTHYNLYVHKKNAAGEYVSFSTYHYAENDMSVILNEGEYRILLQSTNSKAWTDDGSTWRFTNADYCYIRVLGGLEPTATTEFRGRTYELYDYNMKWSEAKQVCEELGGHLATITSAGECEALFLFLEQGNNTRYFIGGTDENKEGTWEWVTGEAWTLNNYWNSGEPNNDGSKEHYLEIRAENWNDVPDNNVYQHGFICEYETTQNLYFNAFSMTIANKPVVFVDTNYINNPIFVSVYKQGKCVDIQKKLYDGSSDSLSFMINDDFDEVRVMMFDSLANLKPLCEMKVLAKEEWETGNS